MHGGTVESLLICMGHLYGICHCCGADRIG